MWEILHVTFPETANIQNVGFVDVVKLLWASLIFAVFSSLLLEYWRSIKLAQRRRRQFAKKKGRDKGVTPKVPPDSILYLPSKPGHDCDDAYDYIVIGSGIGGLTAASLLAQRGHKVLVLEQHTVCGGCCHSFQSGGYRFGTGIHYVGEVAGEKPTLAKSILAAITYPDDPIQWDPLDENFDTLYLGNQSTSTARTYKFFSAGQKEMLKAQFPPEESDAIDEYYELVIKGASAWQNAFALKFLPLFLTKFINRVGLGKYIAGDYCKYASMTIKDLVTSLTDNEDLRAAMCFNWGDHGCDPSEAPWLLQAGLMLHYARGAYYPRGGTQNIPRKIVPTITDSGGQVLAHAPVKEITFARWSGRASGVVMKNGRHITARKGVISDAGLFDTFEHLIPSSHDRRDKLLEKFFGEQDKETEGKLKKSITGMYLAVGLKGDHDDDLHLPHNQYWICKSAEDVLTGNSAPSLEAALQDSEPFLFVTCPSGKDSSWKNDMPGKSSIEIMTFTSPEWFDAPQEDPELGGLADPGGKPNSHGAKYDAVKDQLAERMWSRAREVLESGGATLPPTLSEVDHYQIGSPLTFAHYFRREGGVWYGTKNDSTRYDLKVATEKIRPDAITSDIPGLYLTGQDASCDGLVGAMMGGLMCAAKVEGVMNPFSLVDLESPDD